MIKKETVNPDSFLPLCPLPEILRRRGLEEDLENIKCVKCDKRGVYRVAGKDYECDYYFNDYLLNMLGYKGEE